MSADAPGNQFAGLLVLPSYIRDIVSTAFRPSDKTQPRPDVRGQSGGHCMQALLAGALRLNPCGRCGCYRQPPSPRQLPDPARIADDAGSLPNWADLFAGCQDFVIFCHAGCPDGLGSARLMALALEALSFEGALIIELDHDERATKAESIIDSNSAVVYVDISPYPEDLPLLRAARTAVIIDHHASVLDRIEQLREEMPSLRDFSRVTDNHSAASLVGELMGNLLVSKISDLDRKIAILRKKDVWEYRIPERWAQDAEFFRAFIQSQPRCTQDMIDEFLNDLPSCLEKGRIALDGQKEAAQALFSEIQCVYQALHPIELSVWVVELKDSLQYCTKSFAYLCQKMVTAIILRAIFTSDKDFVDVRVTRTSVDVGDLGQLCRLTYEGDRGTYLGGGGHPFAAGLQVKKQFWNPERVSADLVKAKGISSKDLVCLRNQEVLLLDLDAAPPTPQNQRLSFHMQKSCLRSMSFPGPHTSDQDRARAEQGRMRKFNKPKVAFEESEKPRFFERYRTACGCESKCEHGPRAPDNDHSVHRRHTNPDFHSVGISS